MSLTKYDYSKKSQKVLSKNQSDGLGNKKTFESELNRICEDKKRQKEYKKQLFNQNIKSHIVYMDENGNIPQKINSDLSVEYKKTDGRLKKTSKNKYARKKFLNILIILITVFLILYLSYDLYMSSTMIF